MVLSNSAKSSLSNDETRALILEYFYARNAKATSTLGKNGSSVKIRDVKAELKANHGLSQQQVHSNLTYLISQGWVEQKSVEKQVRAPGGTVITSTTTYYQITAAGIDKIEGPGEFTMPKFHGIRIEATGQNIITLGDGNQIDARFGDLGNALVELRDAITGANISESEKMSIVADIATIQSQLAKQHPHGGIVKAAWEAVKGAGAIAGCASLVCKVTGLIAPFVA